MRFTIAVIGGLAMMWALRVLGPLPVMAMP
jgi:hypothetical protein